MTKLLKEKQRVEQQSKRRRLCRKLDRATLLFGAMILIAALGTLDTDYDLSKFNPQGFAMWFLLLVGWIPLELFGLIRWIFGIRREFSAVGEGPTLGICALTMLTAVWAVIRFYVARICRPEVLQTAFHFMLIFAFWGMFQMLCCLTALGWERSDVAPLDKKLIRRTTPSK